MLIFSTASPSLMSVLLSPLLLSYFKVTLIYELGNLVTDRGGVRCRATSVAKNVKWDVGPSPPPHVHRQSKSEELFLRKRRSDT